VIETFATDEHRIGLKPITRRVWAPRGNRPVAPCHHRFEWLYVTAFVSPATGESELINRSRYEWHPIERRLDVIPAVRPKNSWRTAKRVARSPRP
jgi:hypothetical protein